MARLPLGLSLHPGPPLHMPPAAAAAAGLCLPGFCRGRAGGGAQGLLGSPRAPPSSPVTLPTPGGSWCRPLPQPSPPPRPARLLGPLPLPPPLPPLPPHRQPLASPPPGRSLLLSLSPSAAGPSVRPSLLRPWHAVGSLPGLPWDRRRPSLLLLHLLLTLARSPSPSGLPEACLSPIPRPSVRQSWSLSGRLCLSVSLFLRDYNFQSHGSAEPSGASAPSPSPSLRLFSFRAGRAPLLPPPRPPSRGPRPPPPPLIKGSVI